MTWTSFEVVQATGGVFGAIHGAEVVAESVTTDSRQVPPGSLFVALRGERHDGHDFVVGALAAGAVGAVVDRSVPGADGTRLIVVPDTLRALGDLAAWTRRRWAGTVIGITGSAGKTTTKELIAAVCAAAAFPPPRHGVLKTEGNFNNLIGLPLTVCRLTGREAVVVLEMGMNRWGEIARLTEIARPDYAVITNVGPAHLEGVGGTLAGVAAAKGELFAGVGPEAVLIVNDDDEWIRRLAKQHPGRQVHFGSNAEVSARGVVDLGLDGVAFTLVAGAHATRVRLRLLGVHNVANALAAAAVGYAMGLPVETIGPGLETAATPAQRLQVTRLPNGVTLIDDAYNANPSSVAAALDTLQRLVGRPVVVLGDMRELGGESTRAHRRVGERAAALGAAALVLLGEHAEEVAAGARAGGMSAAAIHVCGSHGAVADTVTALWAPGDCVLVKGSHGVHMDEVVRLLHVAATTG